MRLATRATEVSVERLAQWALKASEDSSALKANAARRGIKALKESKGLRADKAVQVHKASVGSKGLKANVVRRVNVERKAIEASIGEDASITRHPIALMMRLSMMAPAGFASSILGPLPLSLLQIGISLRSEATTEPQELTAEEFRVTNWTRLPQT